MKNQTLKNIIKESITDYLSELNSIDKEVKFKEGDKCLALVRGSAASGYEECTILGMDPSGVAVVQNKDGISDEVYTKDLRPIGSKAVNEDETTKESLSSTPGLMFEDKVTKDKYVYLVKEAMNESTEKNLVEKKLLLDLIGEGYKGAYLNEATAMKAAKTAIKERETLMKENVKKGQAKVGGLEKQVANLKAEMAKLIDNPEMRGELSNYTAKLEKAEQVLEKLKAALEKSSPKKEKKEKKDDE